MDIFDDIKKKIMLMLDEKKINYTKVEAEGSEIAIYTTTPEIYFYSKSVVGEIAEAFKKRINIRSEKSVLMDPADALQKIKKLIPEDAGIKSIFFDPVFSEVIIEAHKPGIVIGKLGQISKDIITETKWIPKILRAPTEPSEILKKVRGFALIPNCG